MTLWVACTLTLIGISRPLGKVSGGIGNIVDGKNSALIKKTILGTFLVVPAVKNPSSDEEDVGSIPSGAPAHTSSIFSHGFEIRTASRAGKSLNS